MKLNVLDAQALGGFETDLDSRVFGAVAVTELRAGEAATGGGGVRGYRWLRRERF